MGFLSVISYAHKLVQERVQHGDCAIDATVGGGNDTLLLARAVGPKGTVYGFDIQREALEQTRMKLIGELGADAGTERVHLLLRSHAEMEDAVPAERHGKIAAIMFNLGYLPNGDHTVITETDATLAALGSSLRLLRARGIATIVVYPGHPGGDAEAAAVGEWAAGLAQRDYQALTYRFANAPATSPYLIAIEKRS